MIEIMQGSGGDVLAVKVSGTLTDKEYKEVLIPKTEAAIKENGKIRFLCQMDAGFKGWEFAAAWDDLTFWLRHKDAFTKLAVVGDDKWVAVGTKLSAHIMSGEVKVFPTADLQKAWEWIQS